MSHNDLVAAQQVGMTLAYYAEKKPKEMAIFSRTGDRTFRELNGRANQLVQTFRDNDLKEGDAIAIVCRNCPEFAEAVFASQRSGLRFTTVSWHLTSREIAYIIDDCDAKAVIGDVRFAEKLTTAIEECPKVTLALSVYGEIPKFQDYEETVASYSQENISDPSIGGMMLYTSGTTGHPKGVYRNPKEPRTVNTLDRIEYTGDYNRDLCTGPLYHTSPVSFSVLKTINMGFGTVMMDKWDAEETLQLIEKYKITHCHFVATMFHRMLQLPENVRNRYDISSLKFVTHGAAPCPIHIKQAMMDWFGPIIREYYGATEGSGTFVTPEEWLERPGTVGKPLLPGIKIRDESGNELPTGEIGYIFLTTPESGSFSYYKDDEKTAKAYQNEKSEFTLGDLGYLDEDGWLFLSDRRSDLIISGGVNIYPAEIDAVFLQHPLVEDACTIGVPNEEWGEEVWSIIELKTGTPIHDELANELIEFCQTKISKIKCPRKIEFSDSLPRTDAGKILRRQLRNQYRNQSR